MIAPNPHYLLFCTIHMSDGPTHDIQAQGSPKPALHRGRWHFVLEQLDGAQRLEVADSESVDAADRLALLCVVRGLEALEQPSRVTLVTTSRYVMRGLKYGLDSWRESGYCWERFGVQKPVRNADLWKRVDGALGYHGVSCKLINPNTKDTPELEAEVPASAPASSGKLAPKAAEASLGLAARGAARPTSEPRPSLVDGWSNWVKGQLQPKAELCGT